MNTPALVRPGLRMGMRPERAHASHHDDIDEAVARWMSHRVNTCLRSLESFSGRLSQVKIAERQFRQMDLAKRNSILLELRESLRIATCYHRSRVKDSRQPNTQDIVSAFALISLALEQTLGVHLHDEQLYAGWCLYEGHFVEMQTGEGKTLTAALPAITAALARVPVHIITSNEYLAQRDLEALSPVYEWFGLRSGVVLSGQDTDKRRQGYASDIAYSTHQQVVFDYLRDQRLLGTQRYGLIPRIHDLLQEDTPPTLQRGLCFAIVDEADSVLIDDARTPLILAQPTASDDAVLAEAAVALSIAKCLIEHEHFETDAHTRRARLLPSGRLIIEEQVRNLAGIWKLPRYRDERIMQALVALHLLRKDVDYMTIDNTVVLLDQSTGRAMPQRRLQGGLHQILEVKERCTLSDETDVVSALSFQSFFTRYHRLSGMSGTLRESRAELRGVYGPRTVIIPTVRACCRTYLPLVVHPTRDAQLSDVVEQILSLRQARRAVLVGTRTVRLSEMISEALRRRDIPHNVLNARHDEDEAKIIADAGLTGAVTVATNMAGRGTDIRCSSTVIDNGGLHVVNLELNIAARIDRQLHGRAARQGEPGSCQEIFSLHDDTLIRELRGFRLGLLAWSIRYPYSVTCRALTRRLVRYAQRSVELRDRKSRMAVFKGQAHLTRALAIGGYGD